MDTSTLGAGSLIATAWRALIAQWRLAALALAGVVVATLIHVLIGIAVIVFAQFELTYAILGNRDRVSSGHPRRRYIALLGVQAITLAIVSVGWMLLLLPGLFLMLRLYFVAPALIVENTGVLDALAVSWRRTAGQEVPLLLATLAAALPGVAAWAWMLAAVTGERSAGAIVAAALSVFVAGVLTPLLCAAIAAVGYADLEPDTRGLAEIFS